MAVKIVAIFFVIVLVAVFAEDNTPKHNPLLATARDRKEAENKRFDLYKSKTCSIKKKKYTVAVLYGGVFNGAGTIVSNKWVLLSGDTVYGASPSDFQVIAGSDDGVKGKKYNIKTIVVHPHYNEAFLDYDFALMQIDGTFKWSSKCGPAKIPTKPLKAGSSLAVSGWGATATNGKLQCCTMKRISQKDCEKAYDGFGLAFTDRMSCAYNKGKCSPCDGDWNDPFVKDGTVYSMFIAIGTENICTKDAYPAICARVLSVAPWIKETIKS